MIQGFAYVLRRARPLWAAWLLICACLAASADDAPGFRPRLWKTETGTPADIWAMAQGEDGYLWLGTGNGLYRFDGVHFERFEPPAGERFHSNNITALAMLPDGSLWIGFYYGGASLLHAGHVQHYLAEKGFPDGMVLAFARTRDGAVWAATEGGLARFEDGHWQTVGTDWNYPTRRADWVITGRDGTLWVTTGESLVFLQPGARQFQRTDQTVAKYGVVAQAPDDTLWLSDHVHGTRALPGLTAEHPATTLAVPADVTEFAESYRLLFDRYGNLWGTCVDKGGIYRVAAVEHLNSGRSLRAKDLTETIDRTHGLVSDRAIPLLQDAEGTVWAGTNMGLASFHKNSFHTPDGIALGTASNYGMTTDSRGNVWIANNGTLIRVEDGSGQIVRRDLPDINAMQFDEAGRLWMVGRNRLYSLNGDALTTTEFPISPSLTRVNALALDQDGNPWLSLAEQGLYHLVQGRWRHVTPLPDLANQAPTALAGDGERLWIGYADNRIVRLQGETARLYTATDGLHVGNVTAMDVHGPDVLVGGEQGLARWRDGRIDSMAVADNDAFNGITGILRTQAGDLWLNTGKGVVLMTAEEVALSFAQPTRQPAYRLFDYRDGLPGIAKQAAIVATSVVDGHRRFWFLTNQGPAWIDPDKLHSNPVPPPVAILAVIANGTRYAPDGRVRLPKGTTNLQVQYTAASLAIPDRVRFRYRLDGVDTTWQDAGNRREAFYSNLAPGAYRFRVIAANDDGIWNTQGAQTELAITPWFFQSPWFYVLCLLILVAIAVVFYLWRMRLATERAHLQLMERMSERERIARDIHDTLLQGVQGLLLRLQALLAGPGHKESHSDELKTAIEQARQMVIEGRDKIIALRGDGPQYTELVQSILAVGEDLASLYPATTFQITTSGEARAMLASGCDEILDIAREAIRNAFIHAEATRVDVNVTYETRWLRVLIADDGSGVDEATLKSASELGHWGIVGMRERAERLGAKLIMRKRQPHGTEWLLSVPCRAAFRP